LPSASWPEDSLDTGSGSIEVAMDAHLVDVLKIIRGSAYLGRLYRRTPCHNLSTYLGAYPMNPREAFLKN